MYLRIRAIRRSMRYWCRLHWHMLNMKKRIQQAKAIHSYIVYSGKSGWTTKVDDATRPNGTRQIHKCSEEKIWDALAEWYLDNVHHDITLEKLYDKWINWKSTPLNQPTIKRLQYEWKAYYLNEPLSQKIIKEPVAKITTKDLREWAEELTTG